MKALIFIALIASLYAGAEPQVTIRLAATNYQPYFAEDTPGHGPVSQLVLEAFALRGIKADICFMPWPRAEKDSAEAKYHGLIGGWDTAARREQFHYSSALYLNQLKLFAKADISALKLSQLSHTARLLGLVRGYAYPQKVQQLGFNIQTVISDEELVKMLLINRVDAILADEGTALYWFRHFGPVGGEEMFSHPEIIDSKALHLLFPKNSADSVYLLQEFEQGLAQLQASGRSAEILAGLPLSADVN